MCTVTYIPLGNTVFLTSNRDEKAGRGKALSPRIYSISNASLLFPKDPDAGGTWIAADNKGQAAVLMNGGFERHIPAPVYKKSRGLILLEVLSSNEPLSFFNSVDLSDTEPFTLILWVDNHLYECRWDASKKYCTQKDKTKTHIWSSATLYEKVIVEKRETWFSSWLDQNRCPNADDILNFHLFGGEGDHHNDIRMNRDGLLFTVSVTGLAINNESSTMRYHDMKDDTIYCESILNATALKTETAGTH